MSAVQQQKPKDPNWVCTFSLKRNFTINGVWMEARGYIQEDKSIKITVKKSSSSGSTPPADDFADQF